MNQKNKITYNKGLNKDLSKTKYPQGFYYDLRNGTLLSGSSTDATEISTIKGNYNLFKLPNLIDMRIFPGTILEDEVYSYFVQKALDASTTVNTVWKAYMDTKSPDSDQGGTHKLLGYTHVLNKLILFTKLNERDEFYAIWSVDFDESLDYTDDNYITIRLLYFDDSLDFKYIGDEAIGRYENENISHIYFTDGYNQLRTFNTTSFDWFFKDASQLDVVPIKTISKTNLTDINPTGSLKVGVIQYSHQYFNNNGQQSTFSLPSQLIHLTDSIENIKETFSSGGGGYKGAEVGEDSGKSVTITIPDIDTKFDNIRIVSIFHSSVSEDPVIKIVSEQSTKGRTFVRFTDNGNKSLGTVSLSNFRLLGTSPIIVKTIAEKDNILFAGNVKEKLFMSEALDNFCTRAYRFDSNRLAAVYNSDSSIVDANRKLINGTVSESSIDWQGIDDNESEYTVNPHNITALSDPTLDNSWVESYAYKFMADGINLGGTGPNISFKFAVKKKRINSEVDPNLSDRTQSTSNVGSTITLDEKGIFTSDYKSPYITGYNRSYQRDDIYRFAIVFWSKEGLKSEPSFICDIRMPVESEYTIANSAYTDSICPYVFDNGTCIANILGIDFKVSFTNHTELLSEIQGFSIVRAQRDESRCILGQGLVAPMIYVWGNNDEFAYDIKTNSTIASRTRDNTSIERKATVLCPNYKFIPDLLNATSYTNYRSLYNRIYGFLDHTYDELNETPTVGGYQYKDGDPITDVGYCTFTSPEVLFNRNTKVKSGDRLVVNNYSRTLYYSGASSETPNSDFLWNQLEYSKANPAETDVTKFPENMVTNLFKLGYTNTALADNIRSLTIEEGEIKDAHDDFEINGAIAINGNKAFTIDEPEVDTNGYRPSTFDEFANNTTLFLKLKGSTSVDSELKRLLPSIAANVDYSSSHVLLLANLKRDSLCYGGYTLDNIKNTVYISTGNYIKSSEGNGVWFSEIEDDSSIRRISQESINGIYRPKVSTNKVGSTVFGGDTFITMFQYLSTFGTPITSEEFDAGAAVNTDISTMMIPVESTINCNLRHDIYIPTISETPANRSIAEKKGFIYATDNSLEAKYWYSDHGQEQDLYLYNSVFSKDDLSLFFTPLKNKDGLSSTNITKIQASNVKTSGEILDNWTIFGYNAEIELASTEGEIQDLYAFKNQLYSFQDSGVARIAVNDKALLQDQGSTLNLGSSGVLPYYQYLTKSSGTKHKYSVIATPEIIFYFDTYKNKIYGISDRDGDVITPNGLFSYFLDNVAKLDGEYPNVIATYDEVYKNVHFRLSYKDNTSEELIYSTLFRAFTEFRALNPYMYITIPNKFITLKSIDYYLENKGDENTFYGNYLPLTGTLIINPTNNEFIKVFDIIEYMTTCLSLDDSNKFNVLNKPLTSVRIYNDYQDTGVIDLTTLNNRNLNPVTNRNRTFRINSFRDSLDTSIKNRKSRLKDYYIKIDYVFDKEQLATPLDTANIKFTLKDLFISFRDLRTTQI